MTIRFRCPSGHKLTAEDRKAGREIRCPACGKRTTVPEPQKAAVGNGEGPSNSAARPQPAAPDGPTPPWSSDDRGPEQGKDKSPAMGKEPKKAPASGKKPPPPPRQGKHKAKSAEKPAAATPEPQAPKSAGPNSTPSETGKSAGSPPPKAPPVPPAKGKVEPSAEATSSGCAGQSAASPREKETARDERKRSESGRRKSRRKGRRPAGNEEKPEVRERSPKAKAAEGDAKAEPPESPKPRREKPSRRKAKARRQPKAGAKREPRQKRALRGPRMMPPDTYHADRGRVQTVKLLALVLVGVALFGAAPGILQLAEEPVPVWARAAMLVAVLQIVFVLWTVATPDWSTLWVVMLVFAFSAAAYGMATAITVATPLDKPMPLGIEEVRKYASRWCGCVLLFTALATYLCGRVATRWHKAAGLEVAGRAQPGSRPGRAFS